MPAPFAHLEQHLITLKQQNLYRTRRTLQSAQGIHIKIANKSVINFCSNDYLGLANHGAIIQAMQQATHYYGVGSGSAHLICGHSHEHQRLEEELAQFTNRPRALLFSTGYMANMGVITALMGRGDTLLEDKLNHASLIDGGLLAKAHFKRYAHNNSAHLETLLHTATGNKLIVSDGVFSMDGDIACLNKLSQLASQYNAWLMVDDAHGLGVIGQAGKGVVDYCHLNPQDVPILMGTLGKALGTFGAFIAGSEILIETLIQRARSYIYTTALPSALAAATRKSLQLMQTEQWRRDKLIELIAYFKTRAAQYDLHLLPSTTPIQPLIIGSSDRAVQLSTLLLEQGFLVSAIRPPTVPQGSARLRITLSALHEKTHIDALLNALLTHKVVL